MRVTKAELASRVSDRAGLSRRAAGLAVAALVEALTTSLSAGERVRLEGLGVFEIVRRGARVGRNPRTGQLVDIPPRPAVRFRPARGLHQTVV